MGSLLKLSYQQQKKAHYIIFSVLSIIIAISMVMPFIFMISMSFKPESEIFLEPLKLIPDKIFLVNYKDVFENPYYLQWYINSLVTVFFTMILRIFIVTIAAYAFARLKFRGKEFVFLIIMTGMLVTPQSTIIAKYVIIKQLGILNSMWAIIIPSAFQVFFLFMFRQFFRTIPFELTEAALIDGCSHFKIYYRIILPLVVPILITTALFTFIWTWNDFLSPFIFITSPQKQLLSVGLKYFVDENASQIATQMAGATFGVIPPIILFMIGQKYFIESATNSGIKG